MATSPFLKAFALLQTVPGVGQLSAATILAETGTDLEPFPTAEQMASWAGLCPGNRESAGIQKARKPLTATRISGLLWCSVRGRQPVRTILSFVPASSD